MPSEGIDGLLPVDKPIGPTSHDVVAAARRALHTRRIGHTGTLDPFATGLLLLLVGRATRLAEYFDDLPKHYSARLRLGVGTDTDDLTGTVTAESDSWQRLDLQQIEAALVSQVGLRLQRPPDFSAKKRAGRRAYEAARSGTPLELAPVPVRIDAVRLTAYEPPDVSFEITCGPGTYIRAVARDAGDVLGVPAHLVSLRRTRIGRFTVEDAVPLDELPGPGSAIRPPLEALAHLPTAEVDAAAAADLRLGRPIRSPEGLPEGGPVAVAAEGRLLAIAERREGWLRPRKVLADG